MMVDTTPTEIIEETQTLWETNRHPEGCRHCQRIFLVLPSASGMSCPLCRRSTLEPQPARMRSSEPELMLPFRFGSNILRNIFEGFVSGVWIKPDDFKPEHLSQRTVPIFWPMWLVDSDISGHWQMEAGFDYQVESSKEYYESGQWRSRKQIEDRIRWETRLGHLNTHIQNVATPALEEHQNRKQLAGKYPLNQAQAFDTSKLGGAILEVPDLPPEDAWKIAKPIVDETAVDVCKKAAGAQHKRNYAIKADYENLHWTEFLLPMYATYYLDDEGNPQILVVNGHTGTIHGPRLASPQRGKQIAGIIAGIAGGLLLLTLFTLLLTMIFPPAAVLAAIFGFLGFGLGIAAIIPAAWPVHWNRKHEGPRIATRR